MKFVCDACSARYHIEDQKVRGRTLRIRCKVCGHIITVREMASPTGSDGETASPAHRPWHYSVNGQTFGPFEEENLFEQFDSGKIGDEAYVWNESFTEWLPAAEVEPFALAIDRARSAGRRAQHPATVRIDTSDIALLRVDSAAFQAVPDPQTNPRLPSLAKAATEEDTTTPINTLTGGKGPAAVTTPDELTANLSRKPTGSFKATASPGPASPASVTGPGDAATPRKTGAAAAVPPASSAVLNERLAALRQNLVGARPDDPTAPTPRPTGALSAIAAPLPSPAAARPTGSLAPIGGAPPLPSAVSGAAPRTEPAPPVTTAPPATAAPVPAPAAVPVAQAEPASPPPPVTDDLFHFPHPETPAAASFSIPSAGSTTSASLMFQVTQAKQKNNRVLIAVLLGMLLVAIAVFVVTRKTGEVIGETSGLVERQDPIQVAVTPASAQLAARNRMAAVERSKKEVGNALSEAVATVPSSQPVAARPAAVAAAAQANAASNGHSTRPEREPAAAPAVEANPAATEVAAAPARRTGFFANNGQLAAAPAVSTQAAEQAAGPSASLFTSVLRTVVQESVRFCNQRQVLAEGALPRTRIPLEFMVAASGAVQTVTLERDLRDSAFDKCLQSHKDRWRFPSFSGDPVTFTKAYVVQ